MSDLDFSELDKAVNDAMASGSQSAPIAQTIDAVKSTTPATRRQGKFMDIIRPTATAPVTTVRHQGMTVQPRSTASVPQLAERPSEQPAVIPSVDPASAPSFGIDMDVVPSSEPSIAPAAETLPIVSAPLPEAAVPSEQPATVSPSDIEEPATPTEGDVASVISENEAEPPLSSPFLPNVEVEKRPLGGFSDTPVSGDTAKSVDAVALDEATESIKSDLPMSTLTTPPDDETNSALEALNKESSDTDPATEAVESTPESATPEEPSKEKPEVSPAKEQVATIQSSNNATTSTTSPTSQVAAGGSIAQQYAETPSTSDQTNGAIYDTKTYNKPIKDAPVKKKKLSFAIWILWAVGLILVGGIAAAAYFYMNHQ